MTAELEAMAREAGFGLENPAAWGEIGEDASGRPVWVGASIKPPAQPNFRHVALHTLTAAKLARFAALVRAQSPLTDAEAAALRREWFGHRDTEHLSFAQAVRETMPKLLADVESRARAQALDDAARVADFADGFSAQREHAAKISAAIRALP